MTSKRRKPPKPPVEPDEELTIWDTDEGDKILNDIDKFVKKNKVVTVGAIRDKFPQYTKYIFTAIGLLKVLHKVTFDEHAPTPMRVYTRNDPPPRPVPEKYGHMTVTPPQERPILPFASAMYGPEFERSR
jgi:hypothetical protein